MCAIAIVTKGLWMLFVQLRIALLAILTRHGNMATANDEIYANVVGVFVSAKPVQIWQLLQALCQVA
jgi:predicted ATP-dependent serine protease